MKLNLAELRPYWCAFFDMLSYVFGAVNMNVAHQRENERAAGYLSFERADVRWFLSVDEGICQLLRVITTFRSITIDGDEIEIF